MQIHLLVFLSLLCSFLWTFAQVTQLEQSFSSAFVLFAVALFFRFVIAKPDAPSPRPLTAAVKPLRSHLKRDSGTAIAKRSEGEERLARENENLQQEVRFLKQRHSENHTLHNIQVSTNVHLKTEVAKQSREICSLATRLETAEIKLHRAESLSADLRRQLRYGGSRNLLAIETAPASLPQPLVVAPTAPTPVTTVLPPPQTAITVISQTAADAQTIAILRADLANERALHQVTRGTLDAQVNSLTLQLAARPAQPTQPPPQQPAPPSIQILQSTARATDFDAIENIMTRFLRDQQLIGVHQSANSTTILQVLPNLLQNYENNQTMVYNFEQQANTSYAELFPDEFASGIRVGASQYLTAITGKVKSLGEEIQRLNNALSTAIIAASAPAAPVLPQASTQPVVIAVTHPQTSMADPPQPTTTTATPSPAAEDIKTLHFLTKHFTMRDRLIRAIRNISLDITDLSLPLPTLSKGTDQLSHLFKNKHVYAHGVCLSEIRQLGGMFTQLKTFVEQPGVVGELKPAAAREWRELAKEYEVFNNTDEDEFAERESNAPVTVDPAAAGRQVKPLRKGKGRVNLSHLRP